MGEDPKALGRKIQQVRQQSGLTQQQLCQKAGLSYSTLAKIERGAIKTPSVFTVFQIARVLGTSLDDLLGAVVQGGTVTSSHTEISSKQTSKNGVKFVYLDINGCLVQFFHAAFSTLSQETGVSADAIESAFWHYNDAVCRGDMSMDAFNSALAKRLGTDSVDWQKHYMDAVQPIADMHELASWIGSNYKIGLLSNIMPGFIAQMIQTGILPDIDYDTIIDSSQVGSIKPEDTIYEIAEKHAGVAPEEILFIDDSRTNLMAAEHRNWKVMWFNGYLPGECAVRIKSSLEF